MFGQRPSDGRLLSRGNHKHELLDADFVGVQLMEIALTGELANFAYNYNIVALRLRPKATKDTNKCIECTANDIKLTSKSMPARVQAKCKILASFSLGSGCSRDIFMRHHSKTRAISMGKHKEITL